MVGASIRWARPANTTQGLLGCLIAQERYAAEPERFPDASDRAQRPAALAALATGTRPARGMTHLNSAVTVLSAGPSG
jgi:hypothetical protein